MSSQIKSIFEGTNIKYRTITLPDSTERALRAHFEYERSHPIVTDKDLEEMHTIFTDEQRNTSSFTPIRVGPSRTGIERIVGNNPRSHAQCCNYKQDLLGGVSVYTFLNNVKNCGDNSEYLPCKQYVTDNFQWLITNFKYGFQVAYDIYTKHEIGDRSAALYDEMREEYERIASVL